MTNTADTRTKPRASADAISAEPSEELLAAISARYRDELLARLLGQVEGLEAVLDVVQRRQATIEEHLGVLLAWRRGMRRACE